MINLILAALAMSLVNLSATWLPIRDEADRAYRGDIATATILAGATMHESRLLMRIARFESTFRRDVGSCALGGDGDRSWGPFQHFGPRELVCGSLIEAARVALVDVRRSFTVAKALPVEERLAPYCRGNSWRTDEAKRLARTRYTP